MTRLFKLFSRAENEVHVLEDIGRSDGRDGRDDGYSDSEMKNGLLKSLGDTVPEDTFCDPIDVIALKVRQLDSGDVGAFDDLLQPILDELAAYDAEQILPRLKRHLSGSGWFACQDFGSISFHFLPDLRTKFEDRVRELKDTAANGSSDGQMTAAWHMMFAAGEKIGRISGYYPDAPRPEEFSRWDFCSFRQSFSLRTGLRASARLINDLPFNPQGAALKHVSVECGAVPVSPEVAKQTILKLISRAPTDVSELFSICRQFEHESGNDLEAHYALFREVASGSSWALCSKEGRTELAYLPYLMCYYDQALEKVEEASHGNNAARLTAAWTCLNRYHAQIRDIFGLDVACPDPKGFDGWTLHEELGGISWFETTTCSHPVTVH